MVIQYGDKVLAEGLMVLEPMGSLVCHGLINLTGRCA